MKWSTLKAFFRGVDVDYMHDYYTKTIDKLTMEKANHIIEMRRLNQRIQELEQDRAMDKLVAWQQEFENSAQLIGNKPTNYAKLKEDFE